MDGRRRLAEADRTVNAILIAGLALAKVGFDQYVRFIAPLMGILLVIVLAVLLLGVGH